MGFPKNLLRELVSFCCVEDLIREVFADRDRWSEKTRHERLAALDAAAALAGFITAGSPAPIG